MLVSTNHAAQPLNHAARTFPPMPPIGFAAALCIVVVSLSVDTAGCGGRTPTGVTRDGAVSDGPISDRSVPTDHQILPDQFFSVDVGPNCAPGDAWRSVDQPINEIRILTNEAYPDRIPEGVALRILARVTLEGCDKESTIFWRVDPDNRVVTLELRKWEYLGNSDCPQVAREVTRYAVLPGYSLSRGPWTVTDGAPSNPAPASAFFRIGPCPTGEDCQCQSSGGGTGQAGDTCRYDCECAYPALCVHDGFRAPSADSGECRTVCNSDGDCRDDELCRIEADNAPNGVCTEGRVECTSSDQCPLGYSCARNADGIHVCQPVMNPGLLDTPCQDDCSCAPGYHCIELENGTRKCQVPCQSQSDCRKMQCCGMWIQPNLYTGPTCGECMDRGQAQDR